MADISPDDLQFIKSFENADFSLKEWDHLKHIRMAFIYLQKHSFQEALTLIRNGINYFNSVHECKGYHETRTVAWLRLVNAVISTNNPIGNSKEFCDKHPELLNKHCLLLFYTKDKLDSDEAKKSFIEPNIGALP